MRKRIEDLKTSQSQWAERAVKTASLDEKRAIECLRRKLKLEKQIAELETQEREHSRIEKQLSHDLGLIDERLSQLKQQRNLMRTRQSRAEAVKALHGNDSGMLCEINEIFDRWESRVAECESYGEFQTTSLDELETDFASQEEEEQLKHALHELLEGKQSEPSQSQ